MKLIVNQKTLAVEISPPESGEVIPDWRGLPGVGHNGQHYQLPGSILVEIDIPGFRISFLHPDTDASTGHADIVYTPSDSLIENYQRGEVDFSNRNEMNRVWPDGGWHLIETIVAVENFLQKEIGYEPNLANFILRWFPKKNAVRG